MYEYPPVPEPPLASEKLIVGRKVFVLNLRENEQGRFLKVSEEIGDRRDAIILPHEAFSAFAEALARLIAFETVQPIKPGIHPFPCGEPAKGTSMAQPAL